jgi:hypothetical protein
MRCIRLVEALVRSAQPPPNTLCRGPQQARADGAPAMLCSTSASIRVPSPLRAAHSRGQSAPLADAATWPRVISSDPLSVLHTAGDALTLTPTAPCAPPSLGPHKVRRAVCVWPLP